MLGKLIVCIILTASLSAETKEELEAKGQQELEQGFDQIVVAAGIAGLAIVTSQGNPISAAGGVLTAITEVKNGFEHLKEAKRLFDESRECDNMNNENGTYRDPEPASSRDYER